MTNEECSGVLLWTDDLKAKLAQAEAEIGRYRSLLELAEKNCRGDVGVGRGMCVICLQASSYEGGPVEHAPERSK